MVNPSFNSLIKEKWDEGKFVCVGLDSDYEKIPEHIKGPEDDCPDPVKDSILKFNKSIVDATFSLVCAYKINSAFYEAENWEAMQETFYYIKRNYPDIPIILDAKRGDIGHTNEGYVKMAFETLEADAITVHPYLGKEAMQPFLDQKGKGIFVLVRTSNPGSDEFQNLPVDGKPLYQIVAENIAKNWNSNGNCAVVVGATYPEELKKVRQIVGDIPILIPGIGAQGGDLEASVKNGVDANRRGIIISSSRGIIYSDDPRQATEDLDKKIRDLIS